MFDIALLNSPFLKQREKENTYILALDGDTDFQPSAVMLLIDRLKLYPEVGAACGRIHPTGTGMLRCLSRSWLNTHATTLCSQTCSCPP